MIQAGGERSVFTAGLHIAAGVVMAAYDGCGVGKDRGLEALSWMDNTCSQAAHRDGVDAYDAVFLVEEEDDKMLAVSVFEVFVQERAYIFRASHLGYVVVGESAFSNKRNAVDGYAQSPLLYHCVNRLRTCRVVSWLLEKRQLGMLGVSARGKVLSQWVSPLVGVKGLRYFQRSP